MGNTKDSGKPRAAAIGVGSLGRHHARNYAELAREGRVELAGICDIDLETASKIASENDAPVFTDWRELLDAVDLVSIATPTETHCEIACSFLEKGIHVLVEKPMSLSVGEADQMIAAAERSGAKLMVGHLERFNPAMVALRPHVNHPLYFEIHRVSPFPNRSLDVDVVLDVMIHDLDAEEVSVRDDAARELTRIGEPALPALEAALRETASEEVRGRIPRITGAIRAEQRRKAFKGGKEVCGFSSRVSVERRADASIEVMAA